MALGRGDVSIVTKEGKKTIKKGKKTINKCTIKDRNGRLFAESVREERGFFSTLAGDSWW